jgi:two-component system, NtrC family, nitrogen regulation sensor histidine kinase GlnL
MTSSPDAQRQLASLPLAVLLLSPGQVIHSINPAAEQFLGQSMRRLAGRPLHDALSFIDPRLNDRLSDSENPVSAREIDVSIPGIGTRRLDVIAAPMTDAPGWQIVTLHDSTAAEAMGEDTGRADDAVMRAPEVLAHEIKNPLAGIRGAAQLLGRKVGEKDQALTRLIADEVDRIVKLIDQMQTLSQKTTAPLEPCNLHEAVRRASAVLGAAGGKGPRIEEEFDPSLPPLLGNGDALVQVLINLLANAREACGSESKPRVVVRTRFASGLQLHSAGSGKSVRLPIELRVSDNGPGIDPAMRERIFDPFVTTKKSGQGLGLALVRKLVGEMNGRIGHERDEAGGWTHFRLHMPMEQEIKQGGARS